MTVQDSQPLSLVAHMAAALHWPEHIQLVPVISNSMNPTLAVGDILAVDTQQRELADGVYLIQVSDAQVIRRVQILPFNSNRVLLGCDNRLLCPFEEVDAEMLGKAVVGRAIFAEKRFV